MKFSREWLQSYIKEALPNDDILLETLSKKAFEVEGNERLSRESADGLIEDIIYDIKVLPNRFGDALSHYYMAQELCSLFSLTLMPGFTNVDNVDLVANNEFIKIENIEGCTLFETVCIDGVDNRPSPIWLRSRLESIGQKSINAIVDITNYVQFAINKPLHAYDANNVKGGFVIRKARTGEKLLTLDNRDLELNINTLIIADHERPLGLAGIKGGMYSGVNNNTQNIIIESANFDSILIRQTAKRYNLRTDASKRFEAGQSDYLVGLGIDMAVSLFREVFGNDIVIHDRRADGQASIAKAVIKLELSDINSALGTELTPNQVSDILSRGFYNFELEGQNYTIQIPEVRVDLRLEVDMIEEIGRIYGYDNLPRVLPHMNRVGSYDARSYIEMKCRAALSDKGYNETMTYTLCDRGQVEIENSGANLYVRDNIANGLRQSYDKSIANAPLMELDVIRSYEIGSVFSKDKEERHIAIICDDSKKKSKYIDELVELTKYLAQYIGANKSLNYNIISEKPATIEINLSDITLNRESMVYDENDALINLNIDHNMNWKYSHISPYPIITRDVSCYYPANLDSESIYKLIHNALSVSNDSIGNPKGWVKRIYLVDRFDKTMPDGQLQKSVAYRIVYQSDSKTLTDEEVNENVAKAYQALEQAGCILR